MSDQRPRRVVLVSTYDLGHHPFGLASPAAWLRAAGLEVRCLDLAVESMDEAAVRDADAIAFHVPMHTATRMALQRLPQVREWNPGAPIAFYGLYAGVHTAFLARFGIDACFAGEYEAALTRWAGAADAELARGATRAAAPPAADSIQPLSPDPSWTARLEHRQPDREGLPGHDRYARLEGLDGGSRLVAYTEASRGCKHLCRHCPVVPVYGGRFRVVPRDIVLEDVRTQIARGARHVTFGDPDFWNGIGHALPIVRELHREHPDVTYDVTIKIEHLLRHREHLAELRDTGCLFVTSAVESVDDRVLERLDKRHTRADFVAALAACRDASLRMNPTFVAFHPWTTAASYLDLLRTIDELGLVADVATIQLAIRLLLPAGSRLLELDEVRRLAGEFDVERLVHPWVHPDPSVDDLQRRVFAEAQGAARTNDRVTAFARIAAIAHDAAGAAGPPPGRGTAPLAAVPFLTEPWYCCAEPLEERAASI